ncbi:hypothetical protein KW482_11395 [Vibrio fluvialis]|nr:hypothetical protein [Vibrio fluvialis]MBY8047344.1 hypothetical protein [Vibrio fluvialis]MBY8149977.1 hypothetical protein [Vibrio fluvialis]MBY8272578.1 hypothetical protein [Vibrio fluvialis]
MYSSRFEVQGETYSVQFDVILPTPVVLVLAESEKPIKVCVTRIKEINVVENTVIYEYQEINDTLMSRPKTTYGGF